MHLGEVRENHVSVNHITLTDMYTGCGLESRFAQVALSLIR